MRFQYFNGQWIDCTEEEFFRLKLAYPRQEMSVRILEAKGPKALSILDRFRYLTKNNDPIFTSELSLLEQYLLGMVIELINKTEKV